MVDIKKCRQCGYIWVARVVEVKMCPKCKSYEWNTRKINKKDEDKK